MFDRLGGRKIVACLVAIVSGIVFFALSRLSENGFIDLLKWTVLVYIGGNVASDVAAIIGRRTPPTPPT